MATRGRGTTTIVRSGSPTTPQHVSNLGPGCVFIVIVLLLDFAFSHLSERNHSVPSEASVDAGSTLTDTSGTTSTYAAGARGASGAVTPIAAPMAARPQFAAFTQPLPDKP